MEEAMKIKQILTAAFIAGLATFVAFAQDQPAPVKTPRVAKRQVQQQARIKEGVKSGELTKGETQKLKREQAKIQHDKQKAKQDGKVTPQERRHIRREQNKANRDIYRLKNNEQEKK